MARDVDAVLAAQWDAFGWAPVLLGMIQFRSAIRYVWSGPGTLEWDGNTFANGDGSAGTFISVGSVAESTEVQAQGTSVTLSGLDPVDLAEALGDVQVGAPVKLWAGALNPDMTLRGVPYCFFAGTVDKPAVQVAPDSCTISLALENKMINHSRASNRRYTTADQAANGFPNDSGFDQVEILNDLVLKWGS